MPQAHPSPLLALAIGDAVPCDPHGGAAGVLTTPGPRRWHALRCLPQREGIAEAWLARRGIDAFHPVTRRRVTRQGRRAEITTRYLPGYVFADFPGEPIRHRVLDCPVLTGAVTLSSGTWGWLDRAGMRRIVAMRAIDQGLRQAKRTQARRARRARLEALREAQRFTPGDRARMIGGLFPQAEVEIVEIAGPRVAFEIVIFGGATLGSASADQLCKIEG